MFRKLTAIAATGALAFGAAACGDNNDSSSSSSTSSPGSSSSAAEKPLANLPSVTGDTTKVTLDKGFVDALTSLKVTPGVIGDAKLSAKGVLTFPITGGNVKYFDPNGSVKPYVQGELDHDGSGLSLTAGGKKVDLENFVIDPGASVLTGKVSVDGKEAVASAPLFFLDGRTLQPLRQNADKTKAVLEGTTVKLKQEAADLLNKTFGIDALKGGLVIGVAKITVPTA